MCQFSRAYETNKTYDKPYAKATGNLHLMTISISMQCELQTCKLIQCVISGWLKEETSPPPHVFVPPYAQSRQSLQQWRLQLGNKCPQWLWRCDIHCRGEAAIRVQTGGWMSVWLDLRLVLAYWSKCLIMRQTLYSLLRRAAQRLARILG